MSTYVNLEIVFPSSKKAQQFSGWLYHEDYLNKTLSGSMVSVTLQSHGDRVVVLEEVEARGGKIIEEDIKDDY